MSNELYWGVAGLSVAVLVLSIIIGITFVLYLRGAVVFVPHDEKRRFKRSRNALSTSSDSSKTDQQHMNDTNIAHDEYVNLKDHYKKANQTKLDAPTASIGRNLGRRVSNKSENSHGNTTSGTYTGGISSTHACRDTVPRLLSEPDCGAKAKGLSYSFVDVTINKDGAEFTCDKANGFPDNFEKSSNPRALRDNVYDRHKGRNELYDVTYQMDHVAIRSNNYDHAQTLGGTGRLWNVKQDTMK